MSSIPKCSNKMTQNLFVFKDSLANELQYPKLYL